MAAANPDAPEGGGPADGLWLLVPVKPFGEGKSRLAPLLAASERATLSRVLLERLLEAAQDAAVFAGIVVVSRDPDVLGLAAASGAEALPETGATLNGALEQARAFVVAQGAEAIAVLPADLPAVTGAHLRALVAQAPAGPGIVLAPSATGGTNALLVRPPQALPFAFGPESASRHQHLAAARGLPVAVWHSAALAYDIDLPADLSHLAPAAQPDACP
jgi:2-phospho-L-lactate/phosphoenolpyruvate guanylyltransferase